MSDFAISALQRRRLLEGDYTPLDFGLKHNGLRKPSGCEVGARYVLAWTRGQPVWVDGYGIRAEKIPVWYVTVTAVQRHRKGFWRVRFDVTDNRDPDRFLRRIGGHDPDAPSSFDELQAGALPDAEWLESQARLVASFWVRRRLERAAEEQRLRARARSAARRKRAA